MYRQIRSRIKAFTLVELLVVIVIICILVGILIPVLGSVMDRGRKTQCEADLQQFKVALQNYGKEFDYPPSTVLELGIKEENGINSGIESMVIALSTELGDGPYLDFNPEQLQNRDKDKHHKPINKVNQSYIKTNDLFEIEDPWENPYIYFHNRDFASKTPKLYKILGEKTKVLPNVKADKTGNIKGRGRYQLISCGPDGKPNTEDDISIR